MRRIVSHLPTVLVLLCLLASPAAAVTVVVPDDYPTIQAALDAGAEVVQVRDGVAPEDVVIRPSGEPGFAVTIEPWNGYQYWLGTMWIDAPQIRSIVMSDSSLHSTTTLKGLRFLRPIQLSMTAGSLTIDGCRFDSSVAGPRSMLPGLMVSVRNSVILGSAVFASPEVQFLGNAVIGGTAWIQAHGPHDVRNNYIKGPAAVGLDLDLSDSAGPVAGNTIRDVGIGIRCNSSVDLTGNDLAQCSGFGIQHHIEGRSGSLSCTGNRIVDCGSDGIHVTNPGSQYTTSVTLVGNWIQRIDRLGVWLGDALGVSVRNNTILDAGGDGFYAERCLEFDNNVVGRCGVAGVRIADGSFYGDYNTIFSNGDDGVLVAGAAFHGTHNILAFNKYGASASMPSTSSCNVWFGNQYDATRGFSAGPTDLFVDPLFCDAVTGDGTLLPGSPVLADDSCGVIGARSEPCAAATSTRIAAITKTHGWPPDTMTAIVPDDFASIQAAHDAGATFIRVRDGLAPQDVVVAHRISIEPESDGAWAAAPSIRSLRLAQDFRGDNEFKMRGLRFMGPLDLRALNLSSFLFESCRFDSGLVGAFSYNMHTASSIRRCLFIGNVTSIVGYQQFVGNIVIGGVVHFYSDGGHDIRDNVVLGPADAGFELRLDGSDGPISGNLIRSTYDGIRVLSHPIGGGRIAKNVIMDCGGDGISSVETWAALRCDSNLVVRCAGAGVAIRNPAQGYAQLTGNVIRACGQDGVRLETSFAMTLVNNTILDCGGDGVLAQYTGQFEGNVIGRNWGVGANLQGINGMFRNTLFSNGGGGLRMWDGGWQEIKHNIFAFNGGPGAVILGNHPPFSSCNNWFSNGGADAFGLQVDATDVHLDPHFCNADSGDAHLSSDSPLLTSAVGYCGLIGALGRGCEAPPTTAVDPPSARVQKFHAFPVPARGPIQFSIPVHSVALELEVFDVLGARRWQATLAAGATSHTWDIRQTVGRRIAAGVYFARLRRGNEELARTRVVVSE